MLDDDIVNIPVDEIHYRLLLYKYKIVLSARWRHFLLCHKHLHIYNGGVMANAVTVFDCRNGPKRTSRMLTLRLAITYSKAKRSVEEVHGNCNVERRNGVKRTGDRPVSAIGWH